MISTKLLKKVKKDFIKPTNSILHCALINGEVKTNERKLTWRVSDLSVGPPLLQMSFNQGNISMRVLKSRTRNTLKLTI